MPISVSKSLSHLHDVPLIQNRRFDVSIILVDDAEPWMDRVFRSLNPHYVRTIEEGEAVLKLYKAAMNG